MLLVMMEVVECFCFVVVIVNIWIIYTDLFPRKSDVVTKSNRVF